MQKTQKIGRVGGKLKRLVRRLKCKHEMEWFRNIYGDEINSVSLSEVYRSYWKCKHCDKIELRKELHTPNAPDQSETPEAAIE